MTHELIVNLALPFSWTVVADEARQRHQQTTNAAIYSVLDGYHNGPIANASDTTRDDPLIRLETKVDLVLQLVVRLLQQRGELPSAQALELRVDSITWRSAETIPPGSWLQLNVYLEPHLPLPVYLLGRATGSAAGQCRAQLFHQHEQDQAAWEKWLFREHRRHVASLKAARLHTSSAS